MGYPFATDEVVGTIDYGEIPDDIATHEDGYTDWDAAIDWWKQTHAPGTMGGEIKRIVEGMESKD